MDASVFIMEAIGHLLQLVPAMLLYFFCIPEELFRYSRRKTITTFSLVILLETFLRVYIKMPLPKTQDFWGSHEVGSMLLILEIAFLILAAPVAVTVPPFRNMMVLFIVFFGGSAQVMIVNLIRADTGVFTPPLVMTYAAVTVILFPVMKVLFADYAQEYIRVPEARHIKSVFGIVFTLTMVVLVQVMTVSWLRTTGMVPVTVVLIISMMMIYWMFLRHVVTGEREDRLQRHLLASQIHPHFIFNTMNIIYGLCDEDLEEAKQAICDFSDYLRKNFETLEKTEPVYFEEELEHTRFYLSLEKLRFGNDMQVAYRIQARDFKLPPLTIQPLVENAVIHGLRKKATPGTITLRTRETEASYEVVIEDDGAGFDTDAQSEDHVHVGISNVRARLERMSNGTLTVESTPGIGTTVTIKIPVKQRK